MIKLAIMVTMIIMNTHNSKLYIVENITYERCMSIVQDMSNIADRAKEMGVSTDRFIVTCSSERLEASNKEK